MSKTAAPAEMANILSLKPLAAMDRQSGAVGGVSFSSIFPAQQPDPAAGAGGSKLPATGSSLPLHTVATGPQAPTMQTSRHGLGAIAVQGGVLPVDTAAVMLAEHSAGETALIHGAPSPIDTALRQTVVPNALVAVPVPEAAVNATPELPPLLSDIQDAGVLGAASMPQSETDTAVQPENLAALGASGNQNQLPEHQQALHVQTDNAQPPQPAMAVMPSPVPHEAAQSAAQMQAQNIESQSRQPDTNAPSLGGAAVQSLQTAASDSVPLPDILAARPEVPVAGVFDSRQTMNPAASHSTVPASADTAAGLAPRPAAPVAEPGGMAGVAASEPRASLLVQDARGPADDNGMRAAINSYPADEARRQPVETGAHADAARQVTQTGLNAQAGGSDLQNFLQAQQNAQTAGNSAGLISRSGSDFLALLQNVATDNASLLPSARVPVTVGHPGWDRAVGQQLAMFISQDVSAAKLRLNPQHLGPVEMHINLDGDKANVAFLSQHSVVREALESSLPRLREMLADSGLNLVNVNVSQQGADGQNSRTMNGFRQDGELLSHAAAGGGEGDEETAQTPAVLLGLIDAYA